MRSEQVNHSRRCVMLLLPFIYLFTVVPDYFSSCDSRTFISPLPLLSSLFYGTFIHAPEYGGGIEILRRQLVGVEKETGRIAFVTPVTDQQPLEQLKQQLQTKYVFPASGITTLSETQFFIPGFIDTHCHAPQFQFTGTGTDRDLMVWLQTYTFPAEMRMANVDYAREVYGQLVRAALAAGTTSIFYYGTIHLEATKALVDTCVQLGQRAFVGKVNMDQYAPDGYCETMENSLKDTEAFIQYVNQLKSPLVKPVITPRFIPTCSVPLLEGLSALAKKYSCWIQSHASESSDQVAFVQSLLPSMGGDGTDPGLVAGRCTGIFDKLGLLSNQCMMAHGTFLTKPEWNIFRERGVSIAHCPISNSFCSDKYLKLKPCLNNGNKVGLGSDIAGGYQLSILANIRQAVVTSKFHTFDIAADPSKAIAIPHHEARVVSATALAAQAAAKLANDNTVNGSTLSYKDAFWLATSGGAEAINMAHELGQFKAGFLFDAQLIDVSPAGVGRTIHLFPSDSLEDIFQKFINLGDDRHVQEVYVQGRPVKTTPPPATVSFTKVVPVSQTNGAEVAASALTH